jgi:hypothetical protein
MGIEDRDYMRDRARSRSNASHNSWSAAHRSSVPKKKTSDPKSTMWTVIIVSVILFAIIQLHDRKNPKRLVLTPAEGRIAGREIPVLTNKGPLGISEPGYIPIPLAPRVPFPASGSIGWWTSLSPGLPLAQVAIMDVSGDPRSKVYRFRQTSSGARVVDVYLAPGGAAVVSVPVDVYSISLAAGTRWEGQDRQFGPHGGYWDMGQDAYAKASGPGGATYSQKIMPFRAVANSTSTNWQAF